MDSESSELAEYHAAFFKSHECDYKDSIRTQFVDIVFLDFLIVNRVEVLPALRGRRFGLLSVSRLIDLFGENCGLVVMKPFPLQFTNYLDPAWRAPDGVEDPPTAFIAARQKLRRHWARVGFKNLEGMDYYALCQQESARP